MINEKTFISTVTSAAMVGSVFLPVVTLAEINFTDISTIY